MALAITVDRKLAEIKTIHLYGSLAFSGTYPTGGEAAQAELTNLAAFNNKAPIAFVADGIDDFLYRYDSATGKILVTLVSTGAEHAAAAYAAGVTGDVILFHCIVPKG